MGSRWKIKTSRQRHGDVFFRKQFAQTKIFTCRCCVWRFKIVDVFDKYSPVASSQKPQKKEFRYFTLQKTKRFQEELFKKLVPFVVSLLLFGINHEPGYKPKKRIKCKTQDEMTYPNPPAVPQTRREMENMSLA